MSKKILSRIMVILAIIVAIVFWILSESLESFAWFNGYWAATIVAGAIGITLIFSGIFSKAPTVPRRMRIFMGAIALVLAFLAVSFTTLFEIKDTLILPIILLILAVGILISVVVVGGKKWDTGDNQKVGYKNYRQRKKDEEDKK